MRFTPPQNIHLKGRNFLNFVPATFTIALPGSRHHGWSSVTICNIRTPTGPKLFGYNSWFGCVFVQPHNLISSCSNTSFIYWPSLAPPPSRSTNHIHLLPHHSIHLHSTMEDELHDLATQHGYQINCNKGVYIPGKPHQKNGSCCITQSCPEAKWRGMSKYQCCVKAL